MAIEKITFSADAELLDRAEQIAKKKGTTLEEEVRQWLDDFGEGRGKLPPRAPVKRKARKSVKDNEATAEVPILPCQTPKGCLISEDLRHR